MKSKSVIFSIIIISCGFVTACLHGQGQEETGSMAVYDLAPASVSLSDEAPHHVKIKVSLRYNDNGRLSEELSAKNTEMQHIVNILLQGKKFSDLDSESDKTRLAEEIRAHINIRLQTGQISSVIIKEMVLK